MMVHNNHLYSASYGTLHLKQNAIDHATKLPKLLGYHR